MVGADSLPQSLWVIVAGMAKAFANVAFGASLIVMVILAVIPVLYGKRRAPGTPLSWGEAMAASTYVTFALFWAFGVVPHQWLTYAGGELKMRSDAIVAGPGSTGLVGDWFPLTVSKATLADLGAVTLYGIAFVGTIALWAIWQGRGKKATDEVEKSNYGRPLVKA